MATINGGGMYTLAAGGTIFLTNVNPALINNIWDNLTVQATHFNHVLAMPGAVFRRLDTGSAQFLVACYG